MKRGKEPASEAGRENWGSQSVRTTENQTERRENYTRKIRRRTDNKTERRTHSHIKR